MNIYEAYAEIRKQKEELDFKEEHLKKQILEDMKNRNALTEKYAFGSFTVSNRKSYKYTEAVEKLAEDLKMKQIEEQEKNLAEVKISTYVTYKPLTK